MQRLWFGEAGNSAFGMLSLSAPLKHLTSPTAQRTCITPSSTKLGRGWVHERRQAPLTPAEESQGNTSSAKAKAFGREEREKRSIEKGGNHSH